MTYNMYDPSLITRITYESHAWIIGTRVTRERTTDSDNGGKIKIFFFERERERVQSSQTVPVAIIIISIFQYVTALIEAYFVYPQKNNRQNLKASVHRPREDGPSY